MGIQIGIIRTSSIGDVVLASAVLCLIERLVPSAQVIWVGRRPSVELIAQGRENVSIFEFPAKAGIGYPRQVINALLGCDLVIDLQTSSKTFMIRWALARRGVTVVSAKKRKLARTLMVWSALARGRFLRFPQRYLSPSTLQYQMMLEAAVRGLRRIGVKISDDELRASVPTLIVGGEKPRNDPTWMNDLRYGKWLAVAPGASHETKRAPTEVFRGILKRLSGSGKATVPSLVFVGGPDDRKMANQLIDELSWPAPVINLAGKLTLSETALVLAGVNGLLSNDSGLGHICEAVGKPVAVLFGPTAESFGFSPRRDDSGAYSSGIGCRPCSKHGKAPCRYRDKLCFEGIDAAAVTTRVAGWFRETESNL